MNDTKILSRLLSRWFHGVFCFLWMGLVPGVVITCLFFDWKGMALFSVLLLLTAIVFHRQLPGWGGLLYKQAGAWIDHHSALSIFLLLIGIQIAVQLVFGYELAVEPSGDRKIIFQQASEIALSGNWNTSKEYNFYFLRYPNNVGLLLLEAAWFTILRCFGITNFLYANMVLNLLCIDSAIALCVFLAHRKFGKKAAVCFQLLCMAFVPFYTFIPFVYTDTLTLPIVAGILLLFQLVEENWEQQKKKKLYLALAAIGILTFAGFELKPTVAILTIAGILYMLFVKGGRTVFLKTGCLLLAFLLCTGCYQQAVKKMELVDQTDYDKENFPYSHWLMMGLQGFGNYSKGDREYTSSFETKEEKQKANIAMIKARLKNYGVLGLAGHQYIKGVSTWFNGKYDMDFHLQRNPLRQSWMQSIFFKEGKYYFFYSAYCTMYQFFLLAMVGISLVQGYKKCRIDMAAVWKLAVFGLFIFLSFWETKSRYVMHFTPVLLLVALDTMVKCKETVVKFLLAYRIYWPVRSGVEKFL